MHASALLTAAKLHARVDHDDDGASLALMLAAAAGDVLGAANYPIPENVLDLPEDLQLAIIDQAGMLYDARTFSTQRDRPVGLSLAASRITARYRGVRLCLPPTE